jgi:glycosyltransferase involved in cell wall biosynthesis
MVDVLTVQPVRWRSVVGIDEEIGKIVPRDARVVRTYPGPICKLLGMVTRSDAGAAPPSEKPTRQLYRKVLGDIWRFAKLLSVPDGKIEWAPWALRAVDSLLGQHKYDVVISFGYPFTCHIVAYFVKKKYGLHWIADYGDPWWCNPDTSWFPEWRRALDRVIEERLLKHCDRIVVCTEGTREAYLQEFSFLDERRVVVITNGYDVEEFKRIPPIQEHKFRLVYTGRVYNLQDSAAFLEALEKVQIDDDMEVIFAGPIPTFLMKGDAGERLSRIIKFLGYQQHSQVASLQMGATVLLLFGAPKGLQVPSKLIEYFAACRPILAIRYDDKDIGAQWVQSYNRGIVANNNPDEIAEAIQLLYALWRRGDIDRVFNLGELLDFSWDRLTERLEVIIREVVA